MGSAILSGILDATIPATDATTTSKESPFSRIIACTKSQASADKLKAKYAGHRSAVRLDFYASDNAGAASQADVVILGCKPYLVDAVLSEEGLCDALAGRLIVSVIAGKTIDVLSAGIAKNQTESAQKKPESTTVVARAIPNVAAAVRESMTVVELPSSASKEQVSIIEWMFSQIGMVKVIGGELFDLGSMLMASLATVSVAVDGILDELSCELVQRYETAAVEGRVGAPRTFKCMHWGTVSECMEYLHRRAIENRGAVERTHHMRAALAREFRRRIGL